MAFQLILTKEACVAIFEFLSPYERHHYPTAYFKHLKINESYYFQSIFQIHSFFLSNYFSCVHLNWRKSLLFAPRTSHCYFSLSSLKLGCRATIYLQVEMTSPWLWVRVWRRLVDSEAISCPNTFLFFSFTIWHLCHWLSLIIFPP